MMYFGGRSQRKYIVRMVQSHTHCKAMVQLACTETGLISLDTYLGERAAVPVLQCCLATSCSPGTTKS